MGDQVSVYVQRLVGGCSGVCVCAEVGGWVVRCLCMCRGWWVGGQVSVYVQRLVGGWSGVCVCALKLVKAVQDFSAGCSTSIEPQNDMLFIMSL